MPGDLVFVVTPDVRLRSRADADDGKRSDFFRWQDEGFVDVAMQPQTDATFVGETDHFAPIPQAMKEPFTLTLGSGQRVMCDKDAWSGVKRS